MKQIETEIKGISPLMHHRFPEEDFGVNQSKKKKKIYEPAVEAEKSLYRNIKNQICVPSEHIYSALYQAATGFRFEGKKTYKDIIKGGIIIEPDMIPLNKEKYDEIDTRSVVVNRGRIIRYRPKFNDWMITFQISIIDEENIDEPVLKEILDKAGHHGIGDFRPRFGRFMVTKFSEIGDAEPRT